MEVQINKYSKFSYLITYKKKIIQGSNHFSFIDNILKFHMLQNPIILNKTNFNLENYNFWNILKLKVIDLNLIF